jgi:hypothetical protein
MFTDHFAFLNIPKRDVTTHEVNSVVIFSSKRLQRRAMTRQSWQRREKFAHYTLALCSTCLANIAHTHTAISELF